MELARKVSVIGSTSVGLAVLLLLPAAGLGSSVVVLTAPYSGVSTTPSSSWSTSGCGHATIHTSPFFQGKTGRGGFFESASSRTCSNVGSSGGSASTGFYSTVPIRLAHSNTAVVAVTVVRSWVAAHLTPATCTLSSTNYSYCYQSAFADLGGLVYLEDTTNQSFWVPSNYWAGAYQSDYVDHYCYSGNCSNYSSNSNGPNLISQSVSWWFNVTGARTSDHFALVVEFYSYAGAYAAAYGATMSGGQTSAGVNAATMGDGIDLASITIG